MRATRAVRPSRSAYRRRRPSAIGRLALLVAVLGALVLLFEARSSSAADPCVVTVTEADGPAALQTALSAAPGTGCTTRRIEISGSFDLASTLSITGSTPVELVGVGDGRPVIRAATASTLRLIDVTATGGGGPARLLVQRMELRGGDADGDDGGAIRAGTGVTLELVEVLFDGNTAGIGAGGAVSADTVELRDVEFHDNHAAFGGAIVAGEVTGERVTFVGNTAVVDEGLGGAIYVTGDVRLVNSTFDGNRAKEGGALFVTSNVPTLIDLEFVTLFGSRADQGAHVAGEAFTLGTTGTIGLVTRGSVFAGARNLAGAATTSDCSGLDVPSSSSQQSVAVGHDAGGTLTTGCTGVTPIAGEPAFGALEFTGGKTRSRAPALDGPLVDAFVCLAGTAATDQRGTSRPQPTGGRCDIGAVEVQQSVEPDPPGDEDDDDSDDDGEDGEVGQQTTPGDEDEVASGTGGGEGAVVQPAGGPIPTRIDAGGGPRRFFRR